MLFKSLFGSHLYGLDTPHSDYDYKAIYQPKLSDVILGKHKDAINLSTNPSSTKNSNEDIDTEVFSVAKFLTLLLQGQAVAIDMFFTPQDLILETSDAWKYIQENKQHWLHKNISPYVGYCRQQANKYGIKGSRVAASRTVRDFFLSYSDNQTLADIWDRLESLAEATEHCKIIYDQTRNMGDQFMFVCCDKKYQKNLKIKYAKEYATKQFVQYGHRARQAEMNENIDWKALSHAVRVADEAIELLQTHHIEFPLKNKEELLKIKQGHYDYHYVAGIIEDRFVELEEAMKNSTLPEKPNWQRREEIILDLYQFSIERSCCSRFQYVL